MTENKSKSCVVVAIEESEKIFVRLSHKGFRYAYPEFCGHHAKLGVKPPGLLFMDMVEVQQVFLSEHPLREPDVVLSSKLVNLTGKSVREMEMETKLKTKLKLRPCVDSKFAKAPKYKREAMGTIALTELDIAISVIFPKQTETWIALLPASSINLNLKIGGQVQVCYNNKTVDVTVRDCAVPSGTVGISKSVADLLEIQEKEGFYAYPVVKLKRTLDTSIAQNLVLAECQGKHASLPVSVTSQLAKLSLSLSPSFSWILGGCSWDEAKKDAWVLARVAKIMVQDTYEVGLSAMFLVNLNLRHLRKIPKLQVSIKNLKGETVTNSFYCNLGGIESISGYGIGITTKLAQDFSLQIGDFLLLS